MRSTGMEPKPVIKEGILFKEGGDSMAKQFKYQTSLMWQSRFCEVKSGQISDRENAQAKHNKGTLPPSPL